MRKILDYLDSVYPTYVSGKELSKMINALPYEVTYELKGVIGAERQLSGNSTLWRYKA